MKDIKKIVVVGGGTAGMVSALILKSRFPSMQIDIICSNTAFEKERLKTSVNQDWSLFIKNDAKNSFTSQEVSNSFENVSFGDAKTIEYQELIASELSKPSENREIVTVDDEEINIDDI